MPASEKFLITNMYQERNQEMSKENLVKLLETAGEDDQLMAQLQQADSYEAVKSLARQQSLDLGDLSEEEAGRTVGVVTGEIKEELTDEELELVAGGLFGSDNGAGEFSLTSLTKSKGFYEGWPVSGLKRGKAT
jgi:hypothetical protein